MNFSKTNECELPMDHSLNEALDHPMKVLIHTMKLLPTKLVEDGFSKRFNCPKL